MTATAHWLDMPAARALGWMLIHFLWEGAVIGVVLAAALPWIKTARMRCAAACLALVVMPAACAVTFLTVLPKQTHHPVVVPALRPAAGGSGSPARPPRGFGAADLPVWAVPVWLAGVLLLEARTLAGWRAARRLRRSGVCAAPSAWRGRLAVLAERMRVSRSVALMESCRVDVPVVIGYFRPVILAPVALLAGMPAGQMEAILLHELAHIRRRDYLINVLQSMIEALLFYHPAVWWISGVVRTEREHCCDDLVLGVSANAREYAAALTALEESRWAGQPAMAATGGDLMRRIRRILGHPEAPHAAPRPALSAALVAAGLAALVVATGAGHARPQNTDNAATTSYENWLNQDVVYIITNEERAAFKRLQTDDEREHFIEQFWLRRDPTPGTVKNEFKEEHYRRIAYAVRHFREAALPGWKTDRGRIYITFGPPDEIYACHPPAGRYCPEPYPKWVSAHNYPYEEWNYGRIEGAGNNVVVEFDDPSNHGEYHMTKDPNGSR